MSNFSTSQTYLLTNTFTGASRQLSSSNGTNVPSMSTGKANTDEQWFLTQSVIPGYWYMHTRALGVSQGLDVSNTAGVLSTGLLMTPILKGTTGQCWRFDGWGDGSYRLSNNFTGLNVYLDTYSDTFQPFLDGGDHTGQHWLFETYSAPTPASTSSSVMPTSSASVSPAIGGSGGGSGVSTGVIVGAVIGGLAVLALIVGAVALVLMYRKKRAKNLGAVSEAPVAPPYSEGVEYSAADMKSIPSPAPVQYPNQHYSYELHSLAETAAYHLPPQELQGAEVYPQVSTPGELG